MPNSSRSSRYPSACGEVHRSSVQLAPQRELLALGLHDVGRRALDELLVGELGLGAGHLALELARCGPDAPALGLLGVDRRVAQHRDRAARHRDRRAVRRRSTARPFAEVEARQPRDVLGDLLVALGRRAAPAPAPPPGAPTSSR